MDGFFNIIKSNMLLAYFPLTVQFNINIRNPGYPPLSPIHYSGTHKTEE